MKPAVQATINLAALKYNLQRVRDCITSHQQIIAVIKANAYGHGIIEVAKALTELDAFAVARLEEAITLRQAGFSQRILILGGIFNTEELLRAIKNQFDLVVHSEHQLCLLELINNSQPINVWLKLDTGMHRLGINPELTQQFHQRLNRINFVNEIIDMTHLADADNKSSDNTEQQLQCFENHSQSNNVSIANSAGILHWHQTKQGWVRPGIMLYGSSPMLKTSGPDENLKAVMTLKSRLIAINQYHQGESIGYGSTWTCPSTTKIGVVAIGYGDGYPRNIAPDTPVLLHNQRCSIVGRVSMDTLSININNSENCQIGDEVTLWGEDLPVDEIADSANTIAYELLCNLTNRVDKAYK
jgi:alanine racemase